MEQNRVIIFRIPLMLIFLAAVTLFSQVSYKSGFIVTLQSDTVYGKIDYKVWVDCPESIDFKGASETIMSYDASEIKGFGVRNEHYISALVEVDSNAVSVNTMGIELDQAHSFMTVFLKVLIEDEKSLYEYIDGPDIKCYYYKADSVFILLENEVILKRKMNQYEGNRDVNSHGVIKENRVYLEQLAQLFNDWGIDRYHLNSTEYDKKTLKNLFEEYYSFTEEKIEYKAPDRRIRMEFGLLAGVSFTYLNFALLGTQDSDLNFISDLDFSLSSNISGGLFCNFSIPDNRNSQSWYNKLMYTSYSVDAFSESDDNFIYSSQFDLSYLKLFSMYRYNGLFANENLFVNAGFSLGYLLANTNFSTIKLQEESTLTPQLYEKEIETDLKSLELGVAVGGGLKIKNFSIELGYEYANGMIPSKSLRGRVHRVYCLFGYWF